MQSALNRLGLRQNLLYELLRGRAAKVLRGGAAPWAQSAASAALAVPLAAAAAPVALALAVAGQGSSVTVYAVKRSR